MIRNNRRDPNSKSVWLDNNTDTQVKPNDFYSNLYVYGTNYGTNTTHYYPDQTMNGCGEGGIVKKIIVPYPVEPYPEIMLKLGEPHTYNSGYTSKTNLGFQTGFDLSNCKDNANNNSPQSEYQSSGNDGQNISAYGCSNCSWR
jgi:hypothetical protein